MRSSRRNPRRAAATSMSLAELDNSSGNDDDDNVSDSRAAAAAASSSSEPEANADDDSSSSEEEDVAFAVKRRKTTLSTRASSRSTRFQRSMQEPKDSIHDLLVVDSNSKNSAAMTSPKKPKSPAKSHLSARRKVRPEVLVDSDSDASQEEDEQDSEEEGAVDKEEEQDDEDEQEALKIQRIVASRSEPRKVWNEICKGINTSEVEYGSRWFQEGGGSNEEDNDDDETFEERFLVKWSDLSYMHCSWETQDDLVEQCDNAKTYLTTFFRKAENGLLFTADERCDGDYFDPSFVQVDRILEIHLPEGTKTSKGRNADNEDPIEAFGIILDRTNPDFDSGTGRQLLVKWKNTSYSSMTYEFERDLVLNDIEYLDHLKAFEVRNKKPTKSEVQKAKKLAKAEKERLAELFSDENGEEKKDARVKAFQDDLANFVFPNGGQLRDYQAEGVTWLVMNKIFNRSSILCDEMGLGKTLQTAAFIDFVDKKMHRRGPFLIVAPLSTIPHWQREFTNWTDLNTFVYHGSANDRELIREFEVAFECDRPRNGVGFNQSFLQKCMPRSRPSQDRNWMAQVVITTPEMLTTDDFVELTHVDWEVLVVDEAHRLKNHNSKLANNLRDHRFRVGHTLLLTGTPIQNNMTELWTLLNFIDPSVFYDSDDFLERYGEVKSKERVDELHENIRPYILRRLKEDVEKSVPPKEETLIEVELTVLQKQYYRALYEKNVQFLHKNKTKAIDGPSLNNLAMQLRKCCNHPFLLNGVEEEVRAGDDAKLPEGDFLVKASGKLVLLDKLLPRLRDDGHRVLIFSQFKIMLDILEDYLEARRIKFERIDGSITGNKRQMAIDRFQSTSGEGKETPLVMLLSTRAGGVGINLTAADTCIIFDSDWNPQNDLQAQARCHRIGQTKNVKVYRLLTRKTYEMQMFHMSSLKMGLDQAVLQGIEGNGSSGEGAMTKEEVERLLRHGAYDIFNEEKAGSADAESNDFVQQDLDSILERRSKTVVHENTGSSSAAAGGTFSKASFKAPKTPSNGQDKAHNDDVDIDDPEFWKKMVGEAKADDSDAIMTGKRRKRTIANYSEAAHDKTLNGTLLLSDDSSDDSGTESDEWSVLDAGPKSPDSDVEVLEALPSAKPARKKKERTQWGGSRSNQWDKKDVEAVLKAMQMFGYSNISWDLFAEKASLDTQRYDDAEELQRMCWSILLFVLQDAADDDALSAKKRAERKAEKTLGAGEKQAVNTATNGTGGILARSDLSALASQDDIRELRYSAFKKLVDANGSWLKKVLEDATAFARTHVPRSKHVIHGALKSQDSPRAPAPHSIEALFAANLWPSLRGRGWTANTIVEGDRSGSRRYVHSGIQYLSLHAVLNSVPGIHPELAKNVENILSSASSQPKRQEETPVLGVAGLDLKSISPSLLASFLEVFAPLQLIVDRARDRKIKWHRKTLNICSVLSIAHTFIDRAAEMPGPKSVNDKIAHLLSLNKRIALPHPSWTSRQDAVLIGAIAKHGWIEQDSCCRAITADGSIKWGAPFDDGEPHISTANDGEVKEPDLELLRDTAREAADFLNTEHDMIEKAKEFNTALIVKSYGLVKSTEAVVESTDETEVSLSTSTKWKVDDSLLVQNLTGQTKGTDRCDADSEVELPTKKELLKRAKAVLSRGFLPSEQLTLAAASATANPSPGHDFSALDQSNPCNMLLSEMLRCLLKLPFVKTSQAKKVARYLCSNAQAEARRLCERAKKHGDENKSEMQELSKVAEHIRLVGRTMASSPRPAKNVLRVVLGGQPIVPKNGLEPLFPFVGTMELQMSVVGAGVSSQPDETKQRAAIKKKSSACKRGDGATGDRAISRAIADGGEKNKEARGKFSDMADPSILELTSSETLILSILCTQGLPVWSDRHAMDLISNYEDTDSDVHAGIDNVITWRGVAEDILAGSEGWAQQAFSRLDRARSMTITASNRAKRLADIADLEREYEAKRLAFALAKSDVANPVKFAKKCIMLLEAVRRKMGPVDTKRGSTAKQIKGLSKSENYLGPRVLSWMGSEIFRWAQSLNIVDRTQQPFYSTAASTVLDGEKGVTLFAVMSKKSCRSVFTQIAQLTRSRSIFSINCENDMRDLVERAVKQSRIADDPWDDKPAWWNQGSNSVHDYDLLRGLLLHGYHVLQNIFSDSDSFAQGKENYQQQFGTTDDGDMEVPLSKRAVQVRVNQLTRELHAQQESKEALRVVDSRRRGLGNGGLRTAEQDSDAKVAAAPPNNNAVQPGIQAFFSSSKPMAVPTSDSKKRGTEVLDLCDDSDDEENVIGALRTRVLDVEIVEPSQVEVLDTDGDTPAKIVTAPPPSSKVSMAKRKDSGSKSNDPAGSQEKKARVEEVEPREEGATSCNVEVVTCSKPNAFAAKRKDCPSGDDHAESANGSPEKKTKTGADELIAKAK